MARPAKPLEQDKLIYIMAKNDAKRQIPRVTGLVLLLLVLIDVIFTILFFYCANNVDSFLKILDYSNAVAQVRSSIVTMCTVWGILCIAKALGSVLVYLWRKEGFLLYTLATLIFIIMFIVLGAKYSVSSFAVKPIIALLIMNVALFGTLFLRSNGASVWSQLKMIQWKKKSEK